MTDARTITMTLGGTWRASYGSCPCPVCQPERRPDQRALSVTEAGGKLLLHCHKAGCDFRNIAAAAGIAPGAVSRPDPAALAAQEAARKAETEKRERQARAIWAETVPIGGTLAEDYLQRRGITCALPETLRFHPDLWHASATRWPALVALVEGGNGFGIHRTYLSRDGAGKAPVEPAKAMLGTCSGGAVRLSSFPGPLVVCEGIETGLSLICGWLEEPATVLAALSTSGMCNLRLPRQPGHLTVGVDGDKAGRDAAETLCERAYFAGWRVFWREAAAGQDFNDMLQARGVAK